MTSFRKTLEEDVRQQLPSLTAGAFKKLLDKLLEVAEFVDDLPQLEVSDIQPPLRLLQARKLVKFFKQKYDEAGQLADLPLQPPSMDRTAQWAEETLDQPRGQLESPSDDDNQSETGSREGEGELPHLLKSTEAMSVCSSSSVLPQDTKPSYDSGAESLLEEHRDDVVHPAKEVPGEQTEHPHWRPRFLPAPSEVAGGRFPVDGRKLPMLHSTPSVSPDDARNGSSTGPAENGVRSALSSSKSSLEKEEAHRSYGRHIGSIAEGSAAAYGVGSSNTPAFTKEQVTRMFGSRTETRAAGSAGMHVVGSTLSTNTSCSTIEETTQMYGSDAGDYGGVHEEAGPAGFSIREGEFSDRKEDLKTRIAVERRRKTDHDYTLTKLENELDLLGLEDIESSMPIQNLSTTSSVPNIDCKVIQGSDTVDGLSNNSHNNPGQVFRNIHEAVPGKPARFASSQARIKTLDNGPQYSSNDYLPNGVGHIQDNPSTGFPERRPTERQACAQRQPEESWLNSFSNSASTELGSETSEEGSNDEEETVSRTRVILLGHDGSGKTSLVNSLLKKDFSNPNIVITKTKWSTGYDDLPGKVPHMVEITQDASVTVKEKEVKTVSKWPNENPNLEELYFWDFNAHSGFHNTFMTFIARRSFYIIVMDMTKALSDTVSTRFRNQDGDESHEISISQTVADFVNYFCMCIKTFVPNGDSEGQMYPILIVCTHKDKCTDEEVKQYRKELHEYLISKPYRAQIHVEIFTVSNKIEDVSKINQLRETIMTLAKGQSCKLLQSWLTFKEELAKGRAEEVPRKTWAEAKIAGEKVGMDEEAVAAALSALHNVGELFFINDDSLRDFIVTDPRWLLQQLQLVTTPSKNHDLRSKDCMLLDSRGLLHESFLQNVWSEDVRTELCNLMERFAILFPVTSTDLVGCAKDKKNMMYLVPCLLQTAEKPQPEDGTVPPVVLIPSRGILPIGLTTRLIAAMINEDEWKVTGTIYRNAATFLPHGKDSAIKVCITERDCKIHISGKQLKGKALYTDFHDSLKVVLNRLGKIMSSICTEFSVTLGVPCPKCEKKEALILVGNSGEEYNELMYCEQHGDRCDISGYSLWFRKDVQQFQTHDHMDTVIVKPVEILTSLVDQTVHQLGSEVMFICETSSLDVKAKWQKAGVQITADDKYHIKVEGGKHTLVIRDVVQADRSEYTIIFDGGKVLQARLHVDGTSDIREMLGETVATLKMELKDEQARLVGTTGIAARSADTNFTAQIKELKILLEGDVSNIESKGTAEAKAHALIGYLLPCHIPQLVLFMWVMIQVNQSHQLPKSITKVVKTLLSRYNKTGIKQLAESWDDEGRINEPPELLRKLEDQTVTVSWTAELSCTISPGSPEAIIKWSRGSSGDVSSSNKYTVMYTNQVATLTIAAVDMTDEGHYTCKATNSVGAVETTCHLSVCKVQRKGSEVALQQGPSSLNTDTTSLPLQQNCSPQILQRAGQGSLGGHIVSKEQEASDAITTTDNSGSTRDYARRTGIGNLLFMMSSHLPICTVYSLKPLHGKAMTHLSLTYLAFSGFNNVSSLSSMLHTPNPSMMGSQDTLITRTTSRIPRHICGPNFQVMLILPHSQFCHQECCNPLCGFFVQTRTPVHTTY